MLALVNVFNPGHTLALASPASVSVPDGKVLFVVAEAFSVSPKAPDVINDELSANVNVAAVDGAVNVSLLIVLENV